MRVQLRNGYMQAYVQIMQNTHTHKAVTGGIEAKKLLSRLVKVGMFMKILNFCVFNKMVSDRKILWFPSKWGFNHLKRWRNGEVVGKKRIMNYSQKLWPGTVNWLVYYTMCQGPFFHHKGAFNKNALLFLEIWLLLAEMYCPKV